MKKIVILVFLFLFISNNANSLTVAIHTSTKTNWGWRESSRMGVSASLFMASFIPLLGSSMDMTGSPRRTMLRSRIGIFLFGFLGTSSGVEFRHENDFVQKKNYQCDTLKKLKAKSIDVELYISKNICDDTADLLSLHACIFHNQHLNMKLKAQRSPSYITLDENEKLYKLHTKENQYFIEEIYFVEETLLDKGVLYVVSREPDSEFISVDSNNNLLRCQY